LNPDGCRGFSLLLTNSEQSWRLPSLQYNAYPGFFSRLKQPGLGADHPAASGAEV